MLERGLALCQTSNIPVLFSQVASALGAAFALDGRSAEALPLLEQAIERALSGRLRVFLPRWTIQLGEGYLCAGRIGSATSEAQRALTLARSYKQHGQAALALRLLGEIDAHQEPPEVEPAEAHYRQAIAIATELGMRPLLAHRHFGLGKLHSKVGMQQQARAELSTAIELYRAMAMTFWLLQAEEALAEVKRR